MTKSEIISYLDDKSLGYSPEAKFDIPKDFNPCAAKDSLDFSGIEDVYE